MGGPVVKVVRIGLMLGALAAVGCTTFRTPRNVEGPAGWASRPGGTPAGLASREPAPLAPTANGVLAGRVVDGFNREQPGAVIHICATDNPELQRDVQTDSSGYFLVQNLQPGKRYKLVTKTREGKPAGGGTVFATPPNVVLLIKVHEAVDGGAAAATLAPRSVAEGNPSSGGPLLYEQERPQAAPPPATTPNASSPSSSPGPVRLGAPEQRLPPPPPRPEYMTQDDRIAANVPPLARIPGPSPFPDRGPTANTDAPPNAGSDVFTHPLLDLDGRTTNLAAFRGKVTLIDFWGTWCPACIKGMPHLARLDREFGPRGLQIVGIAYEEGPPLEQTQRVRFVAQRQSVNYPLLLGTAQNCAVLRHYQVTRYPTLVLLDEQGQLLWRGEGLGDANLRRLEELIRQRLGQGR